MHVWTETHKIEKLGARACLCIKETLCTVTLAAEPVVPYVVP